MSVADRIPGTEPEDPGGRLFWCCSVVGWISIGFGIWTLFARAGATRPAGFAAWFVGLAVAHDLLVVPAVSLVAVWLVPRVPRRVAGPVVGAAIVSAILALVSLPPLLGDPADNPSLLPRNYVAGLVVALVVVWGATATWIGASLVRRRRAS
jgi:hypothetical protein